MRSVTAQIEAIYRTDAPAASGDSMDLSVGTMAPSAGTTTTSTLSAFESALKLPTSAKPLLLLLDSLDRLVPPPPPMLPQDEAVIGTDGGAEMVGMEMEHADCAWLVTALRSASRHTR